MTNPVKVLTDLVHEDMAAVNQCLMDRMQSDVSLITQLAGYLIASGGKRIRPLLTLASAQLCGYEGQGHIQFATCVELIHTATLLHDDVVDESTMRRGKKTANQVWSNQASVLVGDFLYSRSFQIMVEQGSLECLRILSDASSVIVSGEVLQLSIQNDLEAGEEKYMRVIKEKTAELFAAACEVGGAVSKIDAEKQKALRSFGENFGIAFQLIDDALDYCGEKEKLGKNVGDDFAEGKVTLPVLVAYQGGDAEEKAFWLRCIEKKEKRDGDLERAQSLIRKYGAIEKTVDYAKKYGEMAKASLANFGNSTIKTTLTRVVDYSIQRAY